MSADSPPIAELKSARTTLQKPIQDLPTLSQLLTSIHRSLEDTSASEALSALKILAQVQNGLIENVLPVYAEILEEKENDRIRGDLVGLFVPAEARYINGLGVAIALSSYQVFDSALKTTSSPSAARLLLSTLSLLSQTYNLRHIYSHLHLNPFSLSKAAQTLQWEESTKVICSIPAKVLNLAGRIKEEKGVSIEVPEVLMARQWFEGVSMSVVEIIGEHAGGDDFELEPFVNLFTRFARLGLFPNPSTQSVKALLEPRSRTPSFFTAVMPQLLGQFSEGVQRQGQAERRAKAVSEFWVELLEELDGATTSSIVHSFLFHLTHFLPSLTSPNPSTATSPTPDAHVSLATQILTQFIGPPIPSTKIYKILINDLILGRNKAFESRQTFGQPEEGNWRDMEFRARVIVAWIGRGGRDCIGGFLKRVVEIWGDAREIKYGLMGRMCWLTLLLILTLSLLKPYDSLITNLTFNSPFLVRMQNYMNHSDGSIRRLGMLIGEIVSEMSIPEPGSAEAPIAGKGKGKDDTIKELEGMLDDLDVDGMGPGGMPPKKTATGRTVAMKRLKFGESMWSGIGGGKEECRWLRGFNGLKDADASDFDGCDSLLGWSSSLTSAGEAVSDDTNLPDAPGRGKASDPSAQSTGRGSPSRGRKDAKASKKKPARPVDSDDESLQGYSSASASSSRSPSPTPSDLEEIANDPMLNTSTRPKVQRPVYLIQLLGLLGARTEPDKLEMALKFGEPLIRRKRDFGKELEENAIELARQALALSDPFDLEDFEKRRQGIVIALVACCPREVAPFIIEEYFAQHYSLIQRAAILTGLSMGARECAGLAVAIEPVKPKVDFPSKYLPPALHARYASPGDLRAVEAGQTLRQAIDSVTEEALARGKGVAQANQSPGIVRSRQLRVKGNLERANISELGSNGTGAETAVQPARKVDYKNLAAESFILPMVNRFWIYYEEEMSRNKRSKNRYAVGGTGMILSGLALSQYLSTVAIMVHAALYSPGYLAIICPEVVELALTVGSKIPVSPDITPGLETGTTEEYQNDVVCTAMELLLVSIDGAKEIDGGRTLAIEKTQLLMAVAEWASGILQAESRGEATTANIGGSKEGRIKKAAAGVLVLASGIIEKMQGVME